MTVSVTLGRCSTALAVSTVSFTDRLRLGAATTAGTFDDLTAYRQQLLGLADNEDEQVIPVSFANEPLLDGYYSVDDITAEFLGPQDDGAITVQATLNPLTGYGTTWWETTAVAALRPNTSSITTPHAMIYAMPVAADFGLIGPLLSDVNIAALAALTVADDSVTVTRYHHTGLGTQFIHAVSAPPAKYYVGSARLERLYGSTWYPVVGRQIPRTLTGAWRLTNGFVRLTPGADKATATKLEVWDGGAWRNTDLLHYDSANTGIGLAGANTPLALEVLRNSPETVIVRCSGSHRRETFTIRRGASHIEWTVAATEDTVAANTAGVKFATTVASTNITAGVRRTSNDGQGNRQLFACAVAYTTDTTNGTIRNSGAIAAVPLCIGVALDGSGAGTGNTEAAIVEQYMGPVSWRQRVVIT